MLAELGIPGVETNLAGAICGGNHAAGELYGSDEAAMLGASVATIGLSSADRARAASMVGGLLERGRWHGELEIRDAEGRPLPLDVRATVVLDGSGQAVGFAAALVDLSDRVASEHRVAEIQSRLRLAHRIASLGSWEWLAREDRLIASDAFTSLLGLPPGTELTMAHAIAAMAPEDRAPVESAIEAMRTAGSEFFSAQYRVRGVDGQLRWLEAHCGAIRDRQGELVRVWGTTQDVTERVRAVDQLQEAADFWQGTLDASTAHVAVLDRHGEIIGVNAAWRRFAEEQGGSSDCVGSNYIEVCEASPEPVAQVVAAGLGSLIAGVQNLFELQYACHSPTVQRWVMLRATRYEGAGPLRVVVAHEDITERHRAQEQVLHQAALLDEIDASVIVTDLDRRVLSWNAGAERLYGWSAEEAVGRPAGALIRPADVGSSDLIVASLQREGVWDGEYEVSRRDGSTFPVYVRNRAILGPDGSTVSFVGVSMDISERKESEHALLRARDYLRAVTDSMGEAMYTLDMDGRVTYINQAAEDLLGWPSHQLMGCDIHVITHNRRPDGSSLPIEDCPILHARRDGTVMRVEDDIFIRPDGSELPVAYTAAPFATDDGIEGCVVVFKDITERRAAAALVARDLEKLAWVERIQEALTDDRFVLHAQPIMDLQTGAIVQHELLIRMVPSQDMGLGTELIAPGAFFGVAEEYGLITEIDRWVIDRAAELAATGLSVQVNVSGRSISAPGFVGHVEKAIEHTGAAPERIVFEITETTLVSDEAAARAFVQALHLVGCKVALDDFGTGYGGFTYLKQLPVDFLKIDIEFVRDVQTNSASRNVVQAIVSLAKGFGLKTVGEGVEDQETQALLHALGVDYAQGFHIGRPAMLEADDRHHAVDRVCQTADGSR